jgi:hypothetical protein
MKVCVIGDSHLAAMKLGWEDMQAAFPDFTLTFFGAPFPLIERLAVRNGTIVPTQWKTEVFFRHTSGGEARIDGSYDRVLLCGMKFSIWRVLGVYKHCRAEDEKSDGRLPLSDPCYRRTLEDHLADTTCIATFKLLREIGATPVGIVPTPFPSEESDMLERRYQARARGDEARVAQHFADAAETLGRRLGFAPYLAPASLLASPIATKAACAKDSVGLRLDSVPHAQDEHNHMNAAYGAAMLRGILPALAAQEA